MLRSMWSRAWERSKDGCRDASAAQKWLFERCFTHRPCSEHSIVWREMCSQGWKFLGMDKQLLECRAWSRSKEEVPAVPLPRPGEMQGQRRAVMAAGVLIQNIHKWDRNSGASQRCSCHDNVHGQLEEEREQDDLEQKNLPSVCFVA